MKNIKPKYIIFIFIFVVFFFNTNSVKAVETFGAEASNPTGNPIGGGAGYSDIITQTDSRITCTATTKTELTTCITNAKSGNVVFVPGTANIDLTDTNIKINTAITIASDRGYNGSLGARLFQTHSLGGYNGPFEVDSPNVRITGILLVGPNSTTSPPAYNSNGPMGISVNYSGFELDNCEIYGFGWAGIMLVGNYQGYGHVSFAYIHHNNIHHNWMSGLGYNVSITQGANALVEANRMDYSRCDTASDGEPGSAYEARYNIDGPHGTAYASNNMHTGYTSGYYYMAGDHMYLHHNTYLQTNYYAADSSGIAPNGIYFNHNSAHHSSIGNGRPIVSIGGSYGNVFVYRNYIPEDNKVWEEGPTMLPTDLTASTTLSPSPLHTPVLYYLLNKKVKEGSTISFPVDGADPYNIPLTFTASALPSGAQLIPPSSSYDSATFNWTPTTGQAGTYNITFTASNGTYSTSSTMAITVLAPTYSTTTPIKGDLNNDGSVNSVDYSTLMLKWLYTINITNEDLNADGKVDAKDLGIMMSNWR